MNSSFARERERERGGFGECDDDDDDDEIFNRLDSCYRSRPISV
jgi:hypothetical protein